jgi:hypothetical protein
LIKIFLKEDSTMKQTILALVLGLALAVSAYADRPIRFKAHLEGFNAAGEPVDTNATGQATFEVIDNGTAIRYQVNVAGIENLWMAHIHVASDPVEITDPAGPIAFWFAPTNANTGPPAGATVEKRFQGNLASGLIYSDGHNLAGTGVQGLIDAMVEGRTSVVVHTNAFGNPDFPEVGAAGNSPPGELRGTIR